LYAALLNQNHVDAKLFHLHPQTVDQPLHGELVGMIPAAHGCCHFSANGRDVDYSIQQQTAELIKKSFYLCRESEQLLNEAKDIVERK
jgi:hypothetical protein